MAALPLAVLLGCSAAETTVDYAACGQSDPLPDDCANGACAPTADALRVYLRFKAQAISLSGWSEADFSDRVVITSISHDNFVSIAATVLIGDFRVSEVASVPSDALLTDESIDLELRTGRFPRVWPYAGAHDATATLGAIEAAVGDCAADMQIDWCTARVWNGDELGPEDDYLGIRAYRTNEDGTCTRASVDVVGAAMRDCSVDDCGDE